MEPLEAEDPRQVGRFEIVARLGSGGMGRVYLARLPSGEQFALKMIHQFLADDLQFRRRFHREVMAAQRVTGENTAALVDADPDARPPWMAVEYVDGPTLSELVERGGPLTLASCVRLASGMAQALISIHAAGLVHRDLKPSNVLMGASGARLIDFGIAQASGASSLTMTGLVTGSAGFMSPEQAQAEHVTAASDVFALGTVLFFAATGRRPFGEGSMISVTYRVVHADPDLSWIRDAGLRELIAECLMKDPSRRPTPEEIRDRCPGIADGSRRLLRTGAAMTTLSPAAAIAAAPLPSAPPLPLTQSTRLTEQTRSLQRDQPGQFAQPGQFDQPGGGRHSGTIYPTGAQPLLPTRRESRATGGWAETVRGIGRRPWLAIPVGAALALGTGGVIAMLLTGAPGAPPGTGVTATGVPTDPGPTASLGVPLGQNRPSIYSVPTHPSGLRPTAGRTARPTAKPTTSAPNTSPTATDPAGGDPDPTTTTVSPSPEDTSTSGPTASVTATATETVDAGSAGAGDGVPAPAN
jgi:serine/threonine protein kinase